MDGDGKKHPAPAAASTFEAADGALSGLESIGQAGVEFGGLGSTGRGGGGLSAPARVRLGRHDVDAPKPVRGGVNDDLAGYETSDHALAARSSLWTTDADDAGGADPTAPAPALAQAGRGADPLVVRDREPAVRDMAAVHFLPRAAAGDMFGGGMMRAAALMAMQVGALTLITDLHAPWPNQFVAFLIWLAGCAALFLSRH